MSAPATASIVFLNGQWLPGDAAGLPFLDLGFTTGATIIETMRTFAGELRLAEYHWQRWQTALAYLDWSSPSHEEWLAVVRECASRNQVDNRERTVFAFATPGQASSKSTSTSCTFGCYTLPYDAARQSYWQTHGVRCRIPKIQALPPAVIPDFLKHRSRLHWYLAQQELQQLPDAHPYDAPLLADAHGHLRETAFGNLIGWDARQNALCIPPRSQVLPGIGWQVCEEILQAANWPIEEYEADVTAWVQRCNEMYLCGSALGIVPIRDLAGHQLPRPTSPVWQTLHTGWTQRVGLC